MRPGAQDGQKPATPRFAEASGAGRYAAGAARNLLSLVPDPQAPDARPAKGCASGTPTGRWLLLGIGGFVLGAIGSLGLLAWRGHRLAAPSREAAQRLAQAEADLQAS